MTAITDSLVDKATIHGVLVCVYGRGVLITGESGSGKSDCALELVTRGHQLVADDVVELVLVDDSVFGNAPERFQGLIAVNEIGIIDVRRVFGLDMWRERSRIDLCIELADREKLNLSDPLSPESTVNVLGVQIPSFRLSVNNGRNLMLLLETAVKLIDTTSITTNRNLTLNDLAATMTN